MGFFNKLVQGLSKTRNSFTDKVEDLLRFTKKIDEETLEELEELEELESIYAYDEAKASNDEAIPFEQAISEIEQKFS